MRFPNWSLTWITTCDITCQCAKKTLVWHPTCLIDIRLLKSKSYLKTKREQHTGSDPRDGKTFEKLDDVTVKSNLHVTLSHCWGASESAFGLVRRGHVLTWRRLQIIKLKKEDSGRHSWRLVDRNFDTPSGVYLDKETHKNVCLDSPEDDDKLHSIFSSDNIYCVPAAYGVRTETEVSKYIKCLLLQLAKDDEGLVKDWDETKRQGTYRRICFMKLWTWANNSGDMCKYFE